MISYKFKIDKETAFTYWLQRLVDWIWYFNKDNLNFYINQFRPITEEEKVAFEKFKDILQKPTNGYNWLWGLYDSKPILDKTELADWEEIKKVFYNNFNIIWDREYPKLLNWKKILENYPTREIDGKLLQIKNFFNSSLDEIILVKLLIKQNSSNPNGHVKKEFKNLILLALSSVETKHINQVINVLLHETAHLIDYNSNSAAILNNSFERIIKPLHVKRQNPSWHHLLTESIITSIAESEKPTNKNDVHFQISKVSEELRKITNDYLENNQTIDKNYCDQVCNLWLKVNQSN